MLVYEKGTSVLINYGQNATFDKLVMKVSSIRKEVISTLPVLGSNYTIDTGGGASSFGSPCPGGTIYLQQNWSAIVYDSTKTSFDIIYCGTNYLAKGLALLEILPTRNWSSSIARSLRKVPKSMIFVDDGTISSFEDEDICGVKADRVALVSGSFIGAFNLHKRTVNTFFAPSTMDFHEYVTIRRLVEESGNSHFVTELPACAGIVPNSTITLKTTAVKSTLKALQTPSYSSDDFPAYLEPVSVAKQVSAFVTSVLTPSNALAYLDLKAINGVRDPNLIKSVYFTADQLEYVVNTGLLDEDLVGMIEKFDASGLCVMVDTYTDFQNLLITYNDKYESVRQELAIEASTTLIAEAREKNSYYQKILQEVISEKTHVLRGIINSGKIDASNAIITNGIKPELVAYFPVTPSASDSSAMWLSYCTSIIALHGIQVKEDGTKIFDSSNQDSTFDKAWISNWVEEELLAKYSFLSGIPVTNRQKNYSGCKIICGEVTRWWFFKWFDLPWLTAYPERRVWENDASPNVKADNIRFTNNRISFDLTFDGFPRACNGLESELYSTLSAAASAWKSEIRNFLASNNAVSNVDAVITSISADTSFTPYVIYNSSYTSDKGQKICMQVSVDLFDTSALQLAYLPGFIDLNTGELLGYVDGALDGTSSIAKYCDPAQFDKLLTFRDNNKSMRENLYNTLSEMAMESAYAAVSPLLDQLGDTYVGEPYGVIGDTVDGIPVSLTDVAKVAEVSTAYISGLRSLITDMIASDTTEGKVKTLPVKNFLETLESKVASWQGDVSLIYYDSAAVVSASPIADPNAALHYIFQSGV